MRDSGGSGVLRKAGWILLSLALATTGIARAEHDALAVISGHWHGRSDCVDREAAPACHDEEIDYLFRVVDGPDGRVVRLDAGKMVDGERVPMGELDFGYDAATRSWSSEVRTERFHGRWSFGISEFILHGTLTDLATGRIVRRVSAERPGSPDAGASRRP